MGSSKPQRRVSLRPCAAASPCSDARRRCCSPAPRTLRRAPPRAGRRTCRPRSPTSSSARGVVSFAVAHRAAPVPLPRRAHGALGQRRQGDAHGRLPQPRVRAPPRSRPRGLGAAQPDDPALGQRRGDAGVHHRRHGGPAGPRAPRGHAAHFSTEPDLGPDPDLRRDQTKFFLHLRAFIPARHRPAAFTLLRTIVWEQRWGIARARPDGWTIYFKGGWGSGSGAVDHQVALLTKADERVSIAVLTRFNPNHRYGEQTEEGVARRLLRGLAAR